MTRFIAHRTDGLGARLLNLLVTMVLAERHGGEMAFTWRQVRRDFHAIDFAEAIFAPSFLERHLVPASATRGRGIALIQPDDPFDDAAVRAKLASAPATLVVSRADRPAPLLSAFRTASDNPFARAFARIAFTPPLERARTRAGEIALPEHPVALHLRAGDIVFGSYRFRTGFETKVISLPLAIHLMATCARNGQTPVLFGQDERAVRWLAERFGGVVAAELIGDVPGNAAAQAVLEMALIARMEAIHGGISSFVQVPALVGGIELLDPSEDDDKTALAQVIIDGLGIVEAEAAIDPLHVAFAAWSAATYGRDGLDLSARRRALETAIRHDPANAFYRLELAASHADHGDTTDAEDVVRDAFALAADNGRFADHPAVQVVCQRRRTGVLEAANLIHRLSGATPYLRLVQALAAQRLADYGTARRQLKAALRQRPQDPILHEAARHLRRESLSFTGLLRRARRVFLPSRANRINR